MFRGSLGNLHVREMELDRHWYLGLLPEAINCAFPYSMLLCILCKDVVSLLCLDKYYTLLMQSVGLKSSVVVCRSFRPTLSEGPFCISVCGHNLDSSICIAVCGTPWPASNDRGPTDPRVRN